MHLVRREMSFADKRRECGERASDATLNDAALSQIDAASVTSQNSQSRMFTVSSDHDFALLRKAVCLLGAAGSQVSSRWELRRARQICSF